MHCVYLGVHKKMLVAWITGKYGKKAKLQAMQIKEMSNRILVIAKQCPREFVRRPETLDDLKNYKATQHRQFLLYFGIAAINGIVP